MQSNTLVSMQIGLLHISDIHIQAQSDWVLNHSAQIRTALNTTFEHCQRIYIVVSGDIAYAGNKQE